MPEEWVHLKEYHSFYKVADNGLGGEEILFCEELANGAMDDEQELCRIREIP